MKKTLPLILLFTASSVYAADKAPDATQGYFKYTKLSRHFDINADATYTLTNSSTIQVLNKEAIDSLNSKSVSYSNSLSDMKVVEAYTLKRNGKHIPVPKNNFQVETNTGDEGNSPIISDIKTKTVVFPDVELGDSVVFTYKIIQKEAMFPKQFSFSTVFSNSYICEVCEVSITAPASLNLRVEARDVAGGEDTRAAKDGKRHFLWHYENHTLGKPQSASVDYFDYAPRIIASTFKDYAELAAAYEARAAAKASVTPRITALAHDIAKDAKTDREIAKALYEWVSKNIQYAGNCIGVGSVVPHDTDHILDNKIGDCKDHTALLQALLAAKNIKSMPALINSGDSYALPELPIVEQFDHVINYIPSLDIYADSTAQHVPFGTLPYAEEGKPVLQTDPYNGPRQTPPTDNKRNWSKAVTDITFNADGSADGITKSTVAGIYMGHIRSLFRALQMTPYKDKATQTIIARSGFKGTGEYTSYDDPDKESDSYNYEMRFHIEDALNIPGSGALGITPFIETTYVPISTFLGFAREDKPEHNYTCLGGATSLDITYHLPKNISILAIPKEAHIKSKYNTYDATYSRDGTTFHATRALVDNTPGNVCTPEQYDIFQPFDVSVTKELRSQFLYQ